VALSAWRVPPPTGKLPDVRIGVVRSRDHWTTPDAAPRRAVNAERSRSGSGTPTAACRGVDEVSPPPCSLTATTWLPGGAIASFSPVIGELDQHRGPKAGLPGLGICTLSDL